MEAIVCVLVFKLLQTLAAKIQHTATRRDHIRTVATGEEITGQATKSDWPRIRKAQVLIA
jgi:hypothetical protein